MGDPNAVFSTKREFLQMAGTLLEEVLNPQVLRTALEAAAIKLGIPDPAGAFEILYPSEDTLAKPAKDRKEKGPDTEKKEKAKRALTTYNVFMAWFSDFASNYGHHPAILKVKADHPMVKAGAGLTAEFYNTLSKEQKKAVKDALSPYVSNLDASNPMELAHKYDAEHPDETIAKLVGLEAKPEFKTDPAMMRAEAATARKQAENGGGTPLAVSAQAPAATPSQPPAAADAEAAVPEWGKGGKDTEKKRKREEEAGAHKQKHAGDEHKPKKEKKEKETKEKEKEKEKGKEKEKKEKKDKEGKDKEEKDKGKEGERKSEKKSEKKKDKEGKGSERKSDKDKKEKD